MEGGRQVKADTQAVVDGDGEMVGLRQRDDENPWGYPLRDLSREKKALPQKTPRVFFA
jgi:hypothetical protein